MVREVQNDIDAIANNLKRSLQSADGGRASFLASLSGSGLREALSGYRQLQAVLIQQRLWAQDHSRSELEPLFQSIAETAGEIHAILAPYADIMRPLKELDKITQMHFENASTEPVEPENKEEKGHEAVSGATSSSPAKSKEAAERRPVPAPRSEATPFLLPGGRKFSVIVELLMAHGPLSPDNLARLARRKDAKNLRNQLDQLMAAGVVCRNGWGRGLSYRLATPFIRKNLRAANSDVA